MPLPLQARLLRVLEEKEVTPLGGETAVKVDVRVVCATHRDLQQMVAAGSFRRDLYFRLAGFAVTLPPLRLRGGRADLIRAMLAELAPGATLEPAALACLAAWHWPGNLRQLHNALQTACALFKPYSSDAAARRMPDDLAADLVRTVSELRVQSNVLTTKQREHADVAQQFQADIERFAELQAGRAQR